jgi:hypothetical protein
VNALCRKNEEFVILKYVLHIRAIVLPRIKMDYILPTIPWIRHEFVRLNPVALLAL